MKIGILFGGRSYEHEISVITAAQAAAVLEREYEVIPIYAKGGEFFLLKKGFNIKDFIAKRCEMKRIDFSRKNGDGGVRLGRRFIPVDCMVMCCHGGEGEDGSFSALMRCYDIPYTSSAVLASAVTMDKRYTKIACERFGIPTARAIWGKRGEDVLEKTKDLSYPLIVKPARLGSSIGIAVAHDDIELIESIAVAFSFDNDVLVEEVIEGAVELNCAAFFERGEVVLGGVENPRSWHEFLTFEEKYEGGKYKSGSNRIVRGELAERVKAATARIYRDFELFGIARADYLYSEKEDVLYLNEINSQPGSLAYYLFEETGISFSNLLRRVIAESIDRFGENDIISIDSGVLDNLSVFRENDSRVVAKKCFRVIK